MAKKKPYTHYEYDEDNELVRVYDGGEEIDAMELDYVIEEWLEERGYEERESTVKIIEETLAEIKEQIDKNKKALYS